MPEPTTTMILPPAKSKTCEEIIASIPRFDSLLHPGIHKQQWWAAAVIAVNKLPTDTTQASIMVALANLAQVGLYLGNALGHAYLVPYRINGSRTCQLQFGYKGYLELAYGNGFLSGVSADFILKGEEVKFRGTERGKRFRHDIDPINRPEPTRNNILAAYCTYEAKSGFHDVVVVPRDELLRIANAAHESSPWHTYFGPMCLKVPIHRASKRWRLTRELAIAAECDEQAERGEPHQCHELRLPASATRKPANDANYCALVETLSGKCGCKNDNDSAYVIGKLSRDYGSLADIKDNEQACAEVLKSLEGRHEEIAAELEERRQSAA